MVNPMMTRLIISSEYFTNDRPSYICSICNQTLSRLSDAGGNNSTYWCRNCSVEFNPELENIRRESKISVPDKNIEPTIATTPEIPDVSIRKEKKLKWGTKELSKKGPDSHITRKEKDDLCIAHFPLG
jgi:DNA-directed RNA polymerase subunit RPC12/RpoP